MAENQGGQSTRPNAALAVGLLFVTILILWFVLHDQIVRFLLAIGWGFMQPLRWTVGLFDPAVFVEIDRWIATAKQVPKQVDIYMMLTLSSEMGKYYRWPLLALMGFLAYKAWRHPIIHLRTRRTLESLVAYQSKVWKPIVPVAHRDLTNDTSPEWRPSRRCMDLAKEQRLIHAGRLKLPETWTYLEQQLGPRLNLDRLQEHEQALFAVFALRILRDRKGASALLDALNESCRGTGRPNYRIAQKVFQKFRHHKRVLSELKGYSYVRTALFQMLVVARAFDGKLPTSHFIWLKPVDRTLWYALDRAPVDPGRLQVASFSEGAAVASQWQAETLARKLKLRMGTTHRAAAAEPNAPEIQYRVEIPYLVTAMVAFAIDLEDCGVVEFPPEIAAALAKQSTNERNRFNIVRDRYVMPGLAKVFEAKRELAANAARSRSTVKGKKHVAV